MNPQEIANQYYDDILERAACLVEKGWCQNAYAENALGKSCLPMDPKATSFCGIGAVMRACGEIGADYLVVSLALCMFHLFNDAEGRTADEVAAELRRRKRGAQ